VWYKQAIHIQYNNNNTTTQQQHSNNTATVELDVMMMIHCIMDHERINE